jgi:hypothetical protein
MISMISMISMIDRLVKAGRRAVNEEHRRAARIQQQLEAQGMGAALLEHMVRHVLDLQQQRSTTSDETLAFLCGEYTGLYRYSMLMEEAAWAEGKKATTIWDNVSPLSGASIEVCGELRGVGPTTPEHDFRCQGGAARFGFGSRVSAGRGCSGCVAAGSAGAFAAASDRGHWCTGSAWRRVPIADRKHRYHHVRGTPHFSCVRGTGTVRARLDP